MLSDEWNLYHFLRESGYANQPKERLWKKMVQVLKSTLIKSTVDKASKTTPGIDSQEHAHQPSGLKDDANNIRCEKDIQMEVSNAATEKESKEVAVDIEKKYDVSEEKEEAPLKASLIFSISLEDSAPDPLILYANQSLMRVMKVMDRFSFGVKPNERLHPKGFESVCIQF